ncbi:MAG: UDP-N-acetylmuramate--L-alanine ligase, partial [Treponema sp.]|nr:UDP-N-acetylmuramate--L-alanine ligase [Treponema sp.]
SQTLAGSVINSFGNSCTFTSDKIKGGKHNYFVAETCEYQRHFMSFYPKKIILTSVEPDHQDYYPKYEDIRQAFVDYACLLPENGDLIFCADDKGAVEVSKIISVKRPDINLIPYGSKAEGKFKLNLIGVREEKNLFNIEGLGNFFLKVPGHHEVLDACAAVTLAVRILQEEKLLSDNFNNEEFVKTGFYDSVRKGLSLFSGGKRRSEIIGKFTNINGDNVVVIDDYGHHPTAVKTTLEGFREFYAGRKIIVDFMSHTYSRTQSLLKEFASSFESADLVILHKIYSSARENPKDFKINGMTLFEETKKIKNDVIYYEEILDALDFVREELNKPLDKENYPDGYLFVTMGAGDNWKLGKALLQV